MAPRLPPSPSSSGSTAGSAACPRSLLHGSGSSSGGSEWKVVVQRNVKSSLLLLLVISSAVFAFSTLYSSPSLTAAAAAATADEALTQRQRQSPLLTAVNVSRDEDRSDERIAPSDGSDSMAPEHRTPADISLTSANASAAALVPTPTTAERTADPSMVGMELEEKCDISVGKWVRDPKGPVYTNLTCPALPDFKNCQMYGKDTGHLYWRWQPDGCDLPRFSPARFLDAVRGKRLAFIGDSLARNQMDSLLCLLSQAETPADVSSGASDKFRTWRFPAHDFTLMAMWTEFYAHAVPVVDASGEPTTSFDIHLDRLGAEWTSRLPELDYAVLSGGNWFFRVNYLWEGGRRVGCVHCREPNLTDVGIAYAVRRVVRAALEGIAGCRSCKRGLVTFLRTYTPDHFEHGSWFDGGYCNRTAPLEESEVSVEGSVAWELRRVQREEMRRVARETTTATATSAARSRRRFGVLDVTRAMMLRADGHPGGHRWMRNGSDCLHWCLPGPVDMWNGALLQRIAEISPPPVVP